MLVAVLGTPERLGLTLVEEPERGLHAKAIRALVDLMRQQASSERPIWLTTHSESVVRALELSELVLVDKVDGRTTMKRADTGNLKQHDLAPLTVDEAWLTNLWTAAFRGNRWVRGGRGIRNSTGKGNQSHEESKRSWKKQAHICQKDDRTLPIRYC
jgi:ABC-type multidrug transport system ATPase subunit